MKRLRYAAPAVAFFWLALAAPSALAFFHFWRFDEIFSNADGTVQFIEMTTTSSGEIFANGVQIRSTSTGKIFTFTGPNLVGPTTNKNLLIATSGFESLPGLSQTPPLLIPDYTLDANFFNPAGDTLRFCTNPCDTPVINLYETRTFGAVPTDGVMSLRFLPSVETAINSPKNYAGTTGSVDLTPPPMTTGDYNGDQTVNAADYTVWRNALGTTVTELGSGADGHADGTIDEQDYAFWKEKFGTVLSGVGNGGGSLVVPEPTLLSLTAAGLWAFVFAKVRTRRTISRH